MATTVEFHVATRDISPRGARVLGELAASVYLALRHLFRKAVALRERVPQGIPTRLDAIHGH